MTVVVTADTLVSRPDLPAIPSHVTGGVHIECFTLVKAGQAVPAELEGNSRHAVPDWQPAEGP